MEREPENDERIEEVDWESRKKSGDRQDATPEQLGASGTGGSSKTSGTGLAELAERSGSPAEPAAHRKSRRHRRWEP